MKISIPLRFLQAALTHASKNDVRFYLNGVCVESSGYVVATDGHRMFVALEPHNCTDRKQTIIPYEALKESLRISPKGATHMEITGAPYPFTLNDKPFIPLDGTFPEWRRVIPKKPIEPIVHMPQFNALYMADGIKAINTAHNPIVSKFKTVSVEIADTDIIVLHAPGTRAMVVLMPIRKSKEVETYDIRQELGLAEPVVCSVSALHGSKVA